MSDSRSTKQLGNPSLAKAHGVEGVGSGGGVSALRQQRSKGLPFQAQERVQVVASAPYEPTTAPSTHPDVRSELSNNDMERVRPTTPSVNRPSTPKMNRPATPNYGSRESSREDVTVEQRTEHKIDQRALEQRTSAQRGSSREDVRGASGGGNADMMGHAIARTLAEKGTVSATPSTTITAGAVTSALPPRAHTPTKAARLAAALLDANAAAKTPNYRGRSVSPKSRKGRGFKQGRLEGQRAQPRERGAASSSSFSTGVSPNPIANANASTVATAEARMRSYAPAGRVAEAKIVPGAVAATRAAATTRDASKVLKGGSMSQLLTGEGQGAELRVGAQTRPQSPGQSASKRSMSPAMADRLAAWRQGIETVPSSSSKATHAATSVSASTDTATDVTNSGAREDEVLASATSPPRLIPSTTTTPAGASATVASGSETAATPTSVTSSKNPVQEARASRQRASESITEAQERRRRLSPAATQRHPSPQSHSKRAMSPVMAARLAAWRMNKGGGEADALRSSSAPGLMTANTNSNVNANYRSDVNAPINNDTKATNLSAAPAWTSMRAVSPSTGRRESPRRTQYAHAHPHSPGRVITRQSSLTSMAAAAAAAKNGPTTPTPTTASATAPSPRPNSPSYAAARGSAGPHGEDGPDSRAVDRVAGPDVVRLASPLVIGTSNRHSNHKRSMSPSMAERLAEWRQNGSGGAHAIGGSASFRITSVTSTATTTTRTNDLAPDKPNSDAPLERPASPKLMPRLEPPATPPPIPSPASPVPSTTSSASPSPPPPPPPPRQRPPSPLSPPEPAQSRAFTTADDSITTPRLHQSQLRQSDRRAGPPERERIMGLRSGGRTVGRSSSAGANSGRPLSPIIAARMSAFQKSSGGGGSGSSSGHGSGGGGGGNSGGKIDGKVVGAAGGAAGDDDLPPSWGLFINSRKGQGQGQGPRRTRANSPLAERVAKWRGSGESGRLDGDWGGEGEGAGSGSVVVRKEPGDGQGGGQRSEMRKESPVSNRLKQWEGRVVPSPTSPLSPAIGNGAGSTLPSGFRRSVPGMGLGSGSSSRHSSSRGSTQYTVDGGEEGATTSSLRLSPRIVTAASKDADRRDEPFEIDVTDQTTDKPPGKTGISLNIPDPAKPIFREAAALAKSTIRDGVQDTVDHEREYAAILTDDNAECPEPAGLSPQEQVSQSWTLLEPPTPSLTIVCQR